ncbi:MAG: prepilin peptidase [Thermoguttaceae bacterium]
MVPQLIPFAIVFVVLLVAAVIDWRSFRVPNVLTATLFTTGLVYHALLGPGGSFLSAVAGAVFGFGILILLYLIGAFGAGDVKLLAGVGAWLGMPLTVYVFAAAGLATGVYSIVVLAHRGGIGRAFTVFRVFGMQLAVLGRHLGTGERIEEIVADHKSRRGRVVPFATMLAVAMIIVAIWACLGNSPGLQPLKAATLAGHLSVVNMVNP